MESTARIINVIAKVQFMPKCSHRDRNGLEEPCISEEKAWSRGGLYSR